MITAAQAGKIARPAEGAMIVAPTDARGEAFLGGLGDLGGAGRGNGADTGGAPPGPEVGAAGGGAAGGGAAGFSDVEDVGFRVGGV